MHFFLSFSLACRCAERALQKGYTVFGLQFYGECWSGQNAEFNFNREGVAKDEKCLMTLNKPTECVQSSNQECVGTQWTNYVYKLTESKLNVAKNNSLTSQLLKRRKNNLHCSFSKCQCFSVERKSVPSSASLRLFTLSPFHSISVFPNEVFSVKIFGENFQNFSVTNVTAFSEFQETRTTLRGVSKFSEIIYSVFCSISLSSRNFRLKSSLFGNSTLSGFCKTFPRRCPCNFFPF